MMIPKTIHYCWFGGNPLPEIAHQCMQSWKKHCPDYEIIRWDESNCDLDINEFVRDAHAHQQWAFVSDYFRLKIVEEYGGIYLDIDVELLKPLDDLLSLEGFMGFEQGSEHYIATGLGFGAVPHHPLITALRQNYENIPFINTDGSFDLTACPKRDTQLLLKWGLVPNNQKQSIAGITCFPADYFSPIDFIGNQNFTENTYSIHHFNASWHPEEQKRKTTRAKQLRKRFGNTLGSQINKGYLAMDEIKEKGLRSLMKNILDKLSKKK